MAQLCQSSPHLPITACDFCGRATFVKAYACHSFVYMKGTSLEHEVGQQWAACEQCAHLIDTQKWAQLTERVVQCFVREQGLRSRDLPVIREQMYRLHGAFRYHMIAES